MKYAFPMIVPASWDKIIHLITGPYRSFKSRILCLVWGIKYGCGTAFSGATILRCRKRGDIEIGKCTVFNSCRRSNLVGLNGPTIIDSRFGGRIKIGDNCGFSSVVMSSMTEIAIGNRVLVGGNVRIFDHDFHSVEYEYRHSGEDRKHIRSKSIVIGDDVFIGTNAIILKGLLEELEDAIK